MATVTRKHQITITNEAFKAAGLRVGDRLSARAVGPGKVLLEREANPVEQYAGALSGVYTKDAELERLRDEWD